MSHLFVPCKIWLNLVFSLCPNILHGFDVGLGFTGFVVYCLVLQVTIFFFFSCGKKNMY